MQLTAWIPHRLALATFIWGSWAESWAEKQQRIRARAQMEEHGPAHARTSTVEVPRCTKTVLRANALHHSPCEEPVDCICGPKNYTIPKVPWRILARQRTGKSPLHCMTLKSLIYNVLGYLLPFTGPKCVVKRNADNFGVLHPHICRASPAFLGGEGADSERVPAPGSRRTRLPRFPK